MTRTAHTECKAGAAVLLHGYAPATVLRIYREAGKHGALMAECRITMRRKAGPHGYIPGEIVTLHAFHAIPRDCVYTDHGRIAWHNFTIHPGALARH
jgi:hypothetical protein